MDSCRKLVIFAVAFVGALISNVTHAGYAQVSPPAGFTTSAGASFYQAAANDVSIANGVRGAAGVVNVGGRAISMPAAYRFAANAGVYAARASFGNPALFATLLIGSAAYNWYTQNGLSVQNGNWAKTDPSACLATCFSYWVTAGGIDIYGNSWSDIASQIVSRTAGGDAYHKYLTCSQLGATGVAGWLCLAQVGDYHYIYGSRASRAPDASPYLPVTQAEMETTLGDKPIPEGLPQRLGYPLPVQNPVLNPSSASVPQAQPLRVPMGQPQPVPNSDPAQWKQPYVDLTPVTNGTPWTVDVVPGEQVKTNPTPLPDAGSVPTVEAGTTEQPVTPDLCEKNPGILACQTVDLGTVTPVAVVNGNKNLAINKDSGWGPDDGTCPAPKTFSVLGVALSMPFTLLCDFATAIRPLFIAFAWLSAALTFFGMGRKE